MTTDYERTLHDNRWLQSSELEPLGLQLQCESDNWLWTRFLKWELSFDLVFLTTSIAQGQMVSTGFLNTTRKLVFNSGLYGRWKLPTNWFVLDCRIYLVCFRTYLSWCVGINWKLVILETVHCFLAVKGLSMQERAFGSECMPFSGIVIVYLQANVVDSGDCDVNPKVGFWTGAHWVPHSRWGICMQIVDVSTYNVKL